MTAPFFSPTHLSTATAEKEARAPCEGWLPSCLRSATTGPSAALGGCQRPRVCVRVCVVHRYSRMRGVRLLGETRVPLRRGSEQASSPYPQTHTTHNTHAPSGVGIGNAKCSYSIRAYSHLFL